MEDNIMLENNKKMSDIKNKLFGYDSVLKNDLKRIENSVNIFTKKNRKINVNRNTELRSLLGKLDLLLYIEYAQLNCELNLRTIINNHLRKADLNTMSIKEEDINTALKYFAYSQNKDLEVKRDINKIILQALYGFGNFTAEEKLILIEIASLKLPPVTKSPEKELR